VFRFARRIIVWLGPNSPADKDVLEILQSFDCEIDRDDPWWQPGTTRPMIKEPSQMLLAEASQVPKGVYQQFFNRD
jgi:hypothetical protein